MAKPKSKSKRGQSNRPKHDGKTKSKGTELPAIEESTTENSPTIRQNRSQNNSKRIFDESGTICDMCQIARDGAWVVQCDGCQRWYHFNCVKFDSEEVGDEEQWFCMECSIKMAANNNSVDTYVHNRRINQNASQTTTIEYDQTMVRPIVSHHQEQHAEKARIESSIQPFTHNECDRPIRTQINSTLESGGETDMQHESYEESELAKSLVHGQNQFVTKVQVHREPDNNLSSRNEMKTPVLSGKTNHQLNQVDVETVGKIAKSNGRNSNRVTSTKAPSTKASSTRALSTTSRITVSSQSRTELGKQRLEAELTLQAKLDEERIALKFEALRLKEERERKFLSGLYQVINDIDEDDISSDGRSRISKNSRNSQSSKRANETGLVLKWVEDQRKQKSQLIQEIPNLSIDTSRGEIQKIQKILQEQATVKEQELPEYEPTAQNARVNSTFIQDNGPTISTFDQQHYVNDVCKQQNFNGNFQSRVGVESKIHEPTAHPYNRNSQSYQPQNIANPPITKIYQQTNTVIPPKSHQSLNQPSKIHRPNQQMIPPQITHTSNQKSVGVQGSGHPPLQSGQSYNQIPIMYGQQSQLPPKIQQPQMNYPGNRITGQSSPNSFNFGPQRQALTANQIAARYVISKKLPDFDGNPKNWPNFIQKYNRTTDACGFDNTENLDRLYECLKDPARTIVESQLSIPDCVPSIIATLEEKYGRKEIVVKAVLEEIRAVQQIKADKLEALSNYGYQVQNVCHTIQSQHMNFYIYDPELIQELVNKLPHQTKIEWARYTTDIPEITLVTLSDWLIKLSRSLNRITMPEIPKISKDKRNDRRSEDSKEDSSWLDTKSNGSKKAYLNTHGNEVSSGVNDNNKCHRCEYCSKGCKSLIECHKFKGISIGEKWKFLYNHKKICRGCLQVHRRKCPNSKECGVNGCTFRHHPLLHDSEKMINTKSANQQSANKPVKQSSGKEKTEPSNSSCNAHRGGQAILYKIIPVQLSNADKTVFTFAYMDDGSGLTLIESELANNLGLRGTPQKLCLRWTNGTVRHENESMRVVLEISGIEENPHQYQLRDVRTVASLDLPEQKIDREKLIKEHPYLARIPFEEFEAAPRILIGLDNIKLCLSRELVEGGWSEPVAAKTLLGWVIHGQNGLVSDEEVQNMQHHVMSITQWCDCDQDERMHRQIEEFFSLENFGIRALTNSVESRDTQRAMEIMEKTTIRKGSSFETGLLWKFDSISFPNNFSMAVKRLECQEKRMQQNPALMENINNQIRGFVKKGYARKLTPEETHVEDPRIWYLPVFHHLDPKKPEKVRLVWDAAAKFKGVSLNSMLLTGPDNLVALIDILRRFREKCVAIGGDIEEMYHQVKVRKEDQNSQRFLWRDGKSDASPDVYVMEVLTFGTSCSPSLAQNVKNKNASEFEQEFLNASNAIKKNHYVDDWLDSQHTVEEAIRLAKEVKYIHRQGGFNLRKFVSNSEKVLEALGNDNGEMAKDLNVSTTLSTQRVLGMWWDAKADCFTYSLKYTKLNEEVLLGLRAPTKRETLKTLMSIYDPLGLIAFFLVHLKILLQEIWRIKIVWDQQLPPELYEKWIRWRNLLPLVETVRIPRLYSAKISPNTAQSIEMHTFVDAGENAYCACCYLRIIDQDGIDCVLVGAKTKVAPLKPLLSIPRLELMAAVLGTRLVKSISESLTLTIKKRYFWSDSADVLCWLRSTTKKYRQFVAFRVCEVLESTAEDEWRWVPGKLNVADDGTKWSKVPCFDQNCRWFRGPEFLYDKECSWPEEISQMGTSEEEIHVHFIHTKPDPPSQIVPERFSKWSRLVNAQALSARYIEKLIAKVRGQSIAGPITAEELRKAERTLYKVAQFECYYDEIVTIKNKKEIFGRKSYVEKSSPIYKCSPYIDEDGLLRVRGRIDKIAGVKYETKRPIILPWKHKITELVVNNYHRMYLHRNNETVINELKQKFFIQKLRVVLKNVTSKCQVCKNKRVKPVIPEMGDLPIARLSPGFRAFTYTGVDYFGPMYVIVKRGTEKRWGVLFTCLTVRAIHIEIVPSLTTDSCILAVRNFTNTRGTPIEFHSDNGTCLKAADKELSAEFEKLDKAAIQSHYTRTYTSWNFNPAAAPHFGGPWERLIGIVKENLRMIMFTRTPKEELLRSYLLEIVNIVNSRPLTYVPIDSAEAEALTPNHFILGTSNGHKAPGDFPFEEKSLTKMWRRSQELANKFWRRWIKEYLPTLTCRSKWFTKANPVKIGDVVLLVDEQNARNDYPRGIVLNVLPDRYGQVRQATVKVVEVVPDVLGRTKDAPVRFSIRTRPIAKLAVLNIEREQDAAVLDVTGQSNDVKPDGTSTSLNGKENVADGNNVVKDLKALNPVPAEKAGAVTVDSRKVILIRRSKRIANQNRK